MLIDIDHFKKHNDTYGHQQGDSTLRAVAQVIADGCRAGEVAARYGGEEFVVILPGSDARAAREAAERCRRSVMDLPEPMVTISVGVASFGRSACSAGDLVAAADGALYTSKHNGRNQVTLASDAATDMPFDPPSDVAKDEGGASRVPAQGASGVTSFDDQRPASL